MLDLYQADWTTLFTAPRFSQVISMLVILALFTALICLLVLLCCKKTKWQDEAFQKKYGAALQGQDIQDSRKSRNGMICYTVIFFVRRITFVSSVLLMSSFVWA